MAIIKCPECGKEISSKATTCIHCGCKITVCPECNSVFSDNLKTCPVCGYVIDKTADKKDKTFEDYSPPTEQDSNGIFDISNIWETHSQEAKIYNKISSIVNWIASPLSTALIVAPLIRLFTWDAAKFILEADSVRNLVISMINASYAVILIWIAIEIILSQVKKYKCAKWIRDNEYDFTPYLKLNEEEIKFSDSIKIDDIKDMAYFAANPSRLKLSYISTLFATIIGFVGSLFFRKFAENLCDYLILNKICHDNYLPQTAELSYDNLIVFIILEVVAFIAIIMCMMLISKKRDKWIETLDTE